MRVAVCIPGQQIERRLALAHQIAVHQPGPDQIVGPQQLKGSGHLPGVEVTLLPHHVLEKGDLAFTDEQRQLTGLSEINLRREEGQGSEPLVAIPGERSRLAASSVPPRQ